MTLQQITKGTVLYTYYYLTQDSSQTVVLTADMNSEDGELTITTDNGKTFIIGEDEFDETVFTQGYTEYGLQ